MPVFLILKLLRPYLERFLAKRTVDYLNVRRARRIKDRLEAQGQAVPDKIMAVVNKSTPVKETAKPPIGLILLSFLGGSVFGFAAAYLLDRER